MPHQVGDAGGHSHRPWQKMSGLPADGKLPRRKQNGQESNRSQPDEEAQTSYLIESEACYLTFVRQ